jgi:DNA-binding transcriptional ArsR family regulator
MDTLSQPYSSEPPAIRIDVRAAYEFVMALLAFNSIERYKGDEEIRAWIDMVRAKATPELLAQLALFRSKSIWLNFYGPAYDCPAPGDVPTFLAYLDNLDARELRLRLLGYYDRHSRRLTSPEVIRRAAEGDAAAQRQFARTAYADEPAEQKMLLQVLALDAQEMKRLLLEALRRWYDEIFREQEPQMMAIVQRDAAAKRALKQTTEPERLIELVANGYEYIPEPFVREIVLIPTYIGRPYVCDVDHHDRVLFCYPVADESLVEDASAPPGRLLRLYKALSDERRLRILKKLTTGDYTLQEIADDFGAGKSTMHYHMVTLRSAGLIRINSRDKRYSLKREAIPGVSEWLAAYLQAKME